MKSVMRLNFSFLSLLADRLMEETMYLLSSRQSLISWASTLHRETHFINRLQLEFNQQVSLHITSGNWKEKNLGYTAIMLYLLLPFLPLHGIVKIALCFVLWWRNFPVKESISLVVLHLLIKLSNSTFMTWFEWVIFYSLHIGNLPVVVLEQLLMEHHVEVSNNACGGRVLDSSDVLTLYSTRQQILQISDDTTTSECLASPVNADATPAGKDQNTDQSGLN